MSLRKKRNIVGVYAVQRGNTPAIIAVPLRFTFSDLARIVRRSPRLELAYG